MPSAARPFSFELVSHLASEGVLIAPEVVKAGFIFGGSGGRALLVARDPEHLTQEFSKVDRGGRILVDTGRNGYSATYAATYTVRAKPGATVSMPLTWKQIEKGVRISDFNMKNVPTLIQKKGDGWADFFAKRQTLKLR